MLALRSSLRTAQGGFALLAWLFCLPLGLVSGADPEVLSFELDVQPVLTARGCNQGACHGKARGQNGFQLSLLGFDSDFDYAALSQNARGRRVFPAAPERSLLLQKATGALPHGGGQRIEPGGDDYELLRTWIAQGLPRVRPDEPKLERIAVEPTSVSLSTEASGEAREHPLRVTAFYSDGTSRDVTSRTAFQSSESGVVSVSPQGRVRAGELPGEAAIMSRYMNHFAVTSVLLPVPGTVPSEYYTALPRQNFVDEHVWNKLQALNITASEPIDDAKYLRRVYLDLIGRLPTPAESRQFLADTDPAKRPKLVDALLERPEYADHWATKWMDLLRPNPYRVGIKAVINYDAWIREQFRRNVPYDQFVRELVTAQGSTWQHGAATLFRDRREPDEIATMMSQLFLGIRLECAKCHHHPSEVWSQDDFYSFAAFFARVGRKGTGLSTPISGGEEMVFLASSGSVRHPLTQQELPPRPLFGEATLAADDDPRDVLAAWMTAGENRYFAEAAVNRIWAELMGQGIVEPVDDLRLTNPPSNPELLAALAVDFREHGNDLKHTIRTIANSYVYQLSSLPTERNAADIRNYSRHYRRRLPAEVLYDAVSDITGVRDTMAAMPPDARGNQIWTTRVDNVFLDTFGRPNPNQDPPCERTKEATVTQALHLMNAPKLHDKVTSDSARPARLAGSELPPEQIVDELYLWTYSRYPDDEERAYGVSLFAEQGGSRRQAAEDLLWALINTPEFVFVD